MFEGIDKLQSLQSVREFIEARKTRLRIYLSQVRR